MYRCTANHSCLVTYIHAKIELSMSMHDRCEGGGRSKGELEEPDTQFDYCGVMRNVSHNPESEFY